MDQPLTTWAYMPDAPAFVYVTEVTACLPVLATNMSLPVATSPAALAGQLAVPPPSAAGAGDPPLALPPAAALVFPGVPPSAAGWSGAPESSIGRVVLPPSAAESIRPPSAAGLAA
ncbi:MAG TPA: hypothetical protein VGI70_10160 [Polyangiales bacterium]